MVFDGGDDYVTVMSDGTGTFNNQTLSISAWVYLDAVGRHHVIVSYDQTSHASPHYCMHLRVNDASNQVMFAWNDGSDYKSLNSSTTLSALTWYHVVATYTSGSQKIYINGSQDASSTRTDTITFYAQEVWLGRGNFGGYFDGILNDVAIWDEALDADAITALYNSGTPLLPTSDSGNYDNSGDLQGYWRNDGITTWTDRANTGVASFDGADDYLDCGDIDDIDGVSKITMCAWVKPSVLGTDDGIFGKGNTGTNRSFMSIKDSSGGIRSGVSTGASWHGYTEDGVLSVGQWAFAVTVFDGTQSTDADKLKVYVNGVQKSLTFSGTSPSVTASISNALHIGKEYNNNTRCWDGQIAGTHIFDVALDSTEVSELYAIDKRSSISGHSQFGNCVGSWLMGAGSGDTTSTLQDQTSNNNDATVSGASLVGYNDGTVAGSPDSIVLSESFTSGRDSQGFYLKDTDENVLTLNGAEYVEVPDSDVLDFGTGDFSVECWFRTSMSSGNGTLVCKANGDGSTMTGFNIDIRGGNDFFIQGGDGTNRQSNTGGGDFSDGNWHHAMVVFDRSSGIIKYVDGSAVGTASGTLGTGTLNVANDLAIGYAEYSDDEFYTGDIDDVRIYSDALSATEVTKNYNAGLSKHRN